MPGNLPLVFVSHWHLRISGNAAAMFRAFVFLLGSTVKK